MILHKRRHLPQIGEQSQVSGRQTSEIEPRSAAQCSIDMGAAFPIDAEPCAKAIVGVADACLHLMPWLPA